MVAVDPEGGVVPCGSLVSDDFVFGNVLDEPLLRILSKPDAKKFGTFRAQFLNRHCLDCEFISICRGGCRSDAYWHSGRYDGEYPYCEARRRTFEYIRSRLQEILVPV